jgi:hypothetical protein
MLILTTLGVKSAAGARRRATTPSCCATARAAPYVTISCACRWRCLLYITPHHCTSPHTTTHRTSPLVTTTHHGSQTFRACVQPPLEKPPEGTWFCPRCADANLGQNDVPSTVAASGDVVGDTGKELTEEENSNGMVEEGSNGLVGHPMAIDGEETFDEDEMSGEGYELSEIAFDLRFAMLVLCPCHMHILCVMLLVLRPCHNPSCVDKDSRSGGLFSTLPPPLLAAGCRL